MCGGIIYITPVILCLEFANFEHLLGNLSSSQIDGMCNQECIFYIFLKFVTRHIFSSLFFSRLPFITSRGLPAYHFHSSLKHL